MNNGIASQHLVRIIAREMSLPDAAVWVRDQNRVLPNDRGLYVVVGMVTSQGISADTYMQDGNPPKEIIQVQQLESIQIDILSRSNDGITRNWEVIAALNSIYSKQQQEANYFKICRVPTGFVNTSSAEGPAQLNRYSLTFACFVWFRKEKVLGLASGDYYDDFTTRVDDENTIGTERGLFDFNISGNDKLAAAAQVGVYESADLVVSS